MSDYISREAAYESLLNGMVMTGYQSRALDCISEFSIPAADVRPVTLCRDCIHYKPQQKSARWSSTTPMCSRSATIKMPPDGFCSFGVKREA